jgi:hypothetical protein
LAVIPRKEYRLRVPEYRVLREEQEDEGNSEEIHLFYSSSTTISSQNWDVGEIRNAHNS